MYCNSKCSTVCTNISIEKEKNSIRTVNISIQKLILSRFDLD